MNERMWWEYWAEQWKDPRKKIGNNQTVPLLGDSFAIVQRQPRRRTYSACCWKRISDCAT